MTLAIYCRASVPIFGLPREVRGRGLRRCRGEALPDGCVGPSCCDDANFLGGTGRQVIITYLPLYVRTPDYDVGIR